MKVAWVSVIISVLALLVSAFSAFYNSRPHIKMETDACVYSRTKKLVAIMVKYSNSSPVAGSIKHAKIVIGNREYGSIEIGEIFNTSQLAFAKTNGNDILLQDNQLRTPVNILPFQSGIGAFIFPDIDPELLQGEIAFTCYFYYVGTYFPKKFSVRAVCGDDISENVRYINGTKNNY